MALICLGSAGVGGDTIRCGFQRFYLTFHWNRETLTFMVTSATYLHPDTTTAEAAEGNIQQRVIRPCNARFGFGFNVLTFLLAEDWSSNEDKDEGRQLQPRRQTKAI